jgi:hypothetical protein
MMIWSIFIRICSLSYCFIFSLLLHLIHILIRLLNRQLYSVERVALQNRICELLLTSSTSTSLYDRELPVRGGHAARKECEPKVEGREAAMVDDNIFGHHVAGNYGLKVKVEVKEWEEVNVDKGEEKVVPRFHDVFHSLPPSSTDKLGFVPVRTGTISCKDTENTGSAQLVCPITESLTSTSSSVSEGEFLNQLHR